ncbi:MAG: class I SAM-dependent methyltransferase [Xanthomonadales bacterium]|nr:class I SAM-dependent methyltransferase [Xanthomonadales bacterium]
MTAVNSRVDVRHAGEYIIRHCQPGSGILEVGSGDGRLALELSRKGYDVLALDQSPDAIAAMRGLGIDVVESDFLEFDGTGFDAVLFSRALHHIHDVDRAMTNVEGLISPGGLVIVDDFDLAAMDEPTAIWFYGMASLLSASGVISGLPESIPDDALQYWLDDHRHEPALLTRREMTEALERRFQCHHEEACPYLYRYLLGAFTSTQRQSQIVALIHEWEIRLITGGAARALGWRSVWKPRSPHLT